MNEFVQGEIDKYCESVLTGCKPCAMFPIQDRYVEEAKTIISKFSKSAKVSKTLFVYTESFYKDWTAVWIYKKKFMLEVIKKIITLFPPEKPETAFDHWALGKAFGYSDEAIEEYIKSHARKETKVS